MRFARRLGVRMTKIFVGEKGAVFWDLGGYLARKYEVGFIYSKGKGFVVLKTVFVWILLSARSCNNYLGRVAVKFR